MLRGRADDPQGEALKLGVLGRWGENSISGGRY